MIWPAAISRRLGDGRILTATQELFGTGQILIDDNPAMHQIAERSGEPTESDGGADFYFQFESFAEAVAAMVAMDDDQAEPNGWIRAAPPRFRRRPDGDPLREFVAP